MTLSTTTIIVLAANSLTAVVCAALLMLVLWQAPHQRANQLFALVMLTLGIYSAINGFSRFVGQLNLDPQPIFFLATTFYALFVVAIFFFASEFAQSRTPTIWIMWITGLILLAFQGLALWTGNLTTNMRPVDSHDGGYQWEFTSLGLFAAATLMAYLLATSVILYRMSNERGRLLWPAPLLVIGSAVSASFVWPIVPIPSSALLLACAAGYMGWHVLRYELFNPRAEMHKQLALKNIELEAANQLKSQFLTNMSHELRTPLNSIIGYTELVINGTYGALNDTQRDRLEKVIRNGHNLLSLIKDVLDLSKIDAGRVVLERRSIPTAPLLDSVLATVEPLALRKGLVVEREFNDAPPLYADETRVRQIMINIVANAVKFTDRGRVIVRAFGEGSAVQLEIADTGIGIHPDQYDAVFAEFQQLDNSSTRRHEGSGLGMAITKKLVELHGGQIWLESAPDQGTTFFVRMPAAEVHSLSKQ